MEKIWKYIDTKKFQANTKYKIMMLLFEIISLLLGLFLWMVIGRQIFSTLDWMLCFAGYPVVISWFVFFYYSINHNFH